MFDEASDINMNSNLNVFVNILLKSGDVKTLTLSLVGIVLCYCSLYAYICRLLSYAIVTCMHKHV